jgi:hypothetical protein
MMSSKLENSFGKAGGGMPSTVGILWTSECVTGLRMIKTTMEKPKTYWDTREQALTI